MYTFTKQTLILLTAIQFTSMTHAAIPSRDEFDIEQPQYQSAVSIISEMVYENRTELPYSIHDRAQALPEPRPFDQAGLIELLGKTLTQQAKTTIELCNVRKRLSNAKTAHDIAIAERTNAKIARDQALDEITKTTAELNAEKIAHTKTLEELTKITRELCNVRRRLSNAKTAHDIAIAERTNAKIARDQALDEITKTTAELNAEKIAHTKTLEELTKRTAELGAEKTELATRTVERDAQQARYEVLKRRQTILAHVGVAAAIGMIYKRRDDVVIALTHAYIAGLRGIGNMLNAQGK